MTDEAIKLLLQEYDAQRSSYSEFAAKVAQLLSELLVAAGIPVHHVTHRAKTRESLERKCRKADASYQSLVSVTDIAGVRVTTFFAEDVDRVAKLVETEFKIDPKNTTDKRALIDPDRFGYLSLHHVVSLLENRARLTEFRRFKNLKVEVQTRSTLQHAWAEIEHDLGYKTAIEVPRHLRRRFSRVAGLLELADQEFNEIRRELKSYEGSVVQKIREGTDTVFIDKASYIAFVQFDPLVLDLDNQLARINEQSKLGRFTFRNENIARLKRVNVESIEDLRSRLQANRKLVPTFAALWIARPLEDEEEEDEEEIIFDTGISIFYLWYVLVAKTRDPQAIEKILTESRFANPKSTAAVLLETLEAAERATA